MAIIMVMCLIAMVMAFFAIIRPIPFLFMSSRRMALLTILIALVTMVFVAGELDELHSRQQDAAAQPLSNKATKNEPKEIQKAVIKAPAPKANSDDTAMFSNLFTGRVEVPVEYDPSDIQQYQLRMKTAWAINLLRLGMFAQICEIRSPIWVRETMMSISLSWSQARHQFRPDSTNGNAYDGYANSLEPWMQKAVRVQLPSPSDCQRAAVSQDMSDLDGRVWEAIGHYH